MGVALTIIGRCGERGKSRLVDRYGWKESRIAREGSS